MSNLWWSYHACTTPGRDECFDRIDDERRDRDRNRGNDRDRDSDRDRDRDRNNNRDDDDYDVSPFSAKKELESQSILVLFQYYSDGLPDLNVFLRRGPTKEVDPSAKVTQEKDDDRVSFGGQAENAETPKVEFATIDDSVDFNGP